MSIYDSESLFEVVGINKIIKSAEVELTLKYLGYDVVYLDVVYLIDALGNYLVDASGNLLIIYT